jgi:hypothetical protein
MGIMPFSTVLKYYFLLNKKIYDLKDVMKIVDNIISKIMQFSNQKFSSNVVEKVML